MAWLTHAPGFLLALPLVLVTALLLLATPVVLVTASRVWLRKEAVPFSYTWRSLLQRRRSALTTFAGFTLVVFVVAAMTMLAQGIERTLASAGADRNVKVVRKNQPNEWTSAIAVEEMNSISALDEIALDRGGEPLVTGEVVILTWLPKVAAATPDDGANITMRGVSERSFQLHPLRELRGRQLGAADGEIIIGKALEGRYRGAALGGTMTINDREWKVVGIADHGGSGYDSEIWCDVDRLRTILQRGGRYSSAAFRLADGASVERLSARLAMDPRFGDFEFSREVDYWRARSGNYVEFVALLGAALGIVFALAAVLGAMNTMYAQVAARTREFGTLRAVGFKRRAILVSVVAESVLLGLAAGVVGLLLASALHDMPVDITTLETLSEIRYAFHMSVTGALLCLAFAALLGYAGGLMPALRAASIPIPLAVRAE